MKCRIKLRSDGSRRITKTKVTIYKSNREFLNKQLVIIENNTDFLAVQP